MLKKIALVSMVLTTALALAESPLQLETRELNQLILDTPEHSVSEAEELLRQIAAEIEHIQFNTEDAIRDLMNKGELSAEKRTDEARWLTTQRDEKQRNLFRHAAAIIQRVKTSDLGDAEFRTHSDPIVKQHVKNLIRRMIACEIAIGAGAVACALIAPSSVTIAVVLGAILGVGFLNEYKENVLMPETIANAVRSSIQNKLLQTFLAYPEVASYLKRFKFLDQPLPPSCQLLLAAGK